MNKIKKEQMVSEMLKPFSYKKYDKIYIGHKETESALRIEGLILHMLAVLERYFPHN